jgi:hypothetical protein
MIYKAYCPDVEGKDGATEIGARTSEEAARLYTERSYRDETWAGEMDVRVMLPDGTEERFWGEPIETIVYNIRKAVS